MDKTLHIVGGGMAGSEAAWQAANAGLDVVIHEMRPTVETFAHQTGKLAEMVCSNSFRSDDDEQNAVGLLHWEMRAAGSIIMATADKHRLPAGGEKPVTLGGQRRHLLVHNRHVGQRTQRVGHGVDRHGRGLGAVAL